MDTSNVSLRTALAALADDCKAVGLSRADRRLLLADARRFYRIAAGQSFDGVTFRLESDRRGHARLLVGPAGEAGF